MVDQALEDSERWFPSTASNPFFVAACVAGEIGEVLNLLKKVERGSHDWTPEMKSDVEEEVADVFTYLLHLAGTLNMDLEARYYEKREANDIRFSARKVLEGHRAGQTIEIDSPTQVMRIRDMNLNPAGEDRFA
jgi:NTP pyrophosphatase (non-canonical NTP hydrolase)